MMNLRSVVRASILSLSLAATTVALAESGDVGSTGSAKATAISGRFKAATTEAEKAARQKSVDHTVGEFFALTRPIARRKLEAKTRISEWIQIKQGAGKITIQFEGREPEACPFEGSAKGKDPEGNDAEFAARWEGEKLVQTVTTEEGKRTNTFSAQSDGSLKVTVELRSTKFETPIRYTLSYASAS